MKKIAFYSIMLVMVSIFACQSKRNFKDYPETSVDKIKGKWMLNQVLVKTSNANGASYQPLIEDITQFRLTFYVDMTYTIESNLPDVWPSSAGSWRFEDNEKIIAFDYGSGVPIRADVLYLTRNSLDLSIFNSTYKTETREFIYKLIPAID